MTDRGLSVLDLAAAYRDLARKPKRRRTGRNRCAAPPPPQDRDKPVDEVQQPELFDQEDRR